MNTETMATNSTAIRISGLRIENKGAAETLSADAFDHVLPVATDLTASARIPASTCTSTATPRSRLVGSLTPPGRSPTTGTAQLGVRPLLRGPGAPSNVQSRCRVSAMAATVRARSRGDRSAPITPESRPHISNRSASGPSGTRPTDG